ncbi:hypothetical protein H5410_015784 [Solanum commersonii]|uniref:Uncharacterized protein n=1 Tax=Solanum commersonii TaxID=4109 RepID=A0A9J5ZUT0_SOLCO|nr:hypothetical protein H5410_015784 [Solanum commersonii]
MKSACILLEYLQLSRFMAYRMNANMLQSLPAAENESFGQLLVISRSSSILDFSNRLEVTEQISKFGVKCMPSPNIRRFL